MDRATPNDNSRDPSLLPENYAAARAILEAHPHLANGLDPEAALHHHARNHRVLGDDMFRLAYRMRPPRNRIEEAQLDYLDGKITTEEHDATVTDYFNRPANETMFEAYYGKLRGRVLAFGKLVMRSIERVAPIHDAAVSKWIEGDLEVHLERARSPLSTTPSEITTADRFAEEARLAQRLPRLEAGECRGGCVHALIRHATEMAYAMLKPGADGRIPDEGLPRLYDGWKKRCLPDPSQLDILLAEEHAAVRMLLNQNRGAVPPKPAEAAVPEPVASPPAPGPLLIADWSHLAIGVDGAWRYYAIAPIPDLDAELRKLIPLDLRRRDWRPLLELAAASPGEQSAPVVELMRRLDAFPEVMSACESEIDDSGLEDATAGMGIEGRQLFEQKLRTKLSRLRCDLRRLIRVRSGDEKLLVVHRDTVETGFVVRFLTQTPSGKYRFIPPPGSPRSPEERG